MCGIVGFVNYKQDILKYKNILIYMNNTLSRYNHYEEDYYLDKHVAFNVKRDRVRFYAKKAPVPF